MLTKDFSHLIGVCYSKMNCWEICKKFYSDILGIDLKHYCEDAPDQRWEIKNLIYANEKDFYKVKTPKFGDLIIIKIHGIESHIAVYIDGGLFLHTTKTTGSVIDRIGKWNKMIVGYYSMNEEQND
jgi:cell wall-associated NlpC family hydrolase